MWPMRMERVVGFCPGFTPLSAINVLMVLDRRFFSLLTPQMGSKWHTKRLQRWMSENRLQPWMSEIVSRAKCQTWGVSGTSPGCGAWGIWWPLKWICMCFAVGCFLISWREKIRRHEKFQKVWKSEAKKTQHTETIRALGVKNQQKHCQIHTISRLARKQIVGQNLTSKQNFNSPFCSCVCFVLRGCGVLSGWVCSYTKKAMQHTIDTKEKSITNKKFMSEKQQQGLQITGKFFF